MIRNDALYRLSLSAETGLREFRVPPDGSVATIRVLGSEAGGTRILFAGREVIASGISGFPRGADVPVRVFVREGTVFLQALVQPEEARSRALLADFNLPPTPLALQLVSLLKQVYARLEPTKIASFIRVAGKFPGKESQAAEAAVLLAEAGLDADEDSVSLVLSAFGEGDSDTYRRDSQAGSRRDGSVSGDLVLRLNRRRDASRQWFVFPFSREIGGVACSGSLRFLIDRNTNSAIETRITFSDGTRTQRFTLDGASCRFSSDPVFLPVSMERIVVYLKERLASCGISDVLYGLIDQPMNTAAENVDVEA